MLAGDNLYHMVQGGLYSAMLHETSSRGAQAWSVLNGITHPDTHTFYTRKNTAKPGNLRSEFTTAVTHCLLVATNFIYPRKDDRLCQARGCHRELNRARWRQRRVCYHTATCSL